MKIITEKNFLWLIGLLTTSIICHAFYISGTLYSNYLVGRDVANFFILSTMHILAADNAIDVFHAIFQTHGQHVLAGMQLVNMASYYLLGHVSLQLINVLGTVYLCIPVLLMAWSAKKNTREWLAICSTVFPLILSPGHYSCAINPACSANHYLGLGLAIISLYLFCHSHVCAAKHVSILLFAEFFLLLAVFSSPAALGLIPVTFLVICIGHKKPWWSLLIHSVVSIFVLYGYFSIAKVPDSILNAASATELTSHILLIVLFCFNMLGSFLPLPESMPLWASLLSVVSGILMTSWGALLIRKYYWQLRNTPEVLFLAAGFILLLMMTALIGLGRFYEFGSPRYIFYACFALAFLILLKLRAEPVKPMGYLYALGIVSITYYLLELAIHQHSLDYFRDLMASCEESWRQHKLACGVMMPHQEISDLLMEADAKGILKLAP